jgi:hypothetical protein
LLLGHPGARVVEVALRRHPRAHQQGPVARQLGLLAALPFRVEHLPLAATVELGAIQLLVIEVGLHAAERDDDRFGHECDRLAKSYRPPPNNPSTSIRRRGSAPRHNALNPPQRIPA